MNHKEIAKALGADKVIDLDKIHWVEEFPTFDLSRYRGYKASMLRHLRFMDGTCIAPAQVPDHWVFNVVANSTFKRSFYFAEPQTQETPA